ncbi:MAG: DUF1801 domain-containing protein [Planctomycetota bacterium]|jgi:hypothetical protein
MPEAPTTVAAYLKQLPEDRRAACTRLRRTIADHIPAGFAEVIGSGMPSWVVPKTRYPDGYHCDPSLPLPFAGFASRKGYVALYHMGLYADPELMAWWQEQWPRHATTRLDMGKSCVRFKKPETMPLDLLGQLFERMTPEDWIACYEQRIRR